MEFASRRLTCSDSAALHVVMKLLASSSTSLTQTSRGSSLRGTRLLHPDAPCIIAPQHAPLLYSNASRVVTPRDASTSLGRPVCIVILGDASTSLGRLARIVTPWHAPLLYLDASPSLYGTRLHHSDGLRASSLCGTRLHHSDAPRVISLQDASASLGCLHVVTPWDASTSLGCATHCHSAGCVFITRTPRASLL